MTAHLLKGYQRFYKKYFADGGPMFKTLAKEGQNPYALVIGCSDSRVDPSILLDTQPGEIFVVRNVANLVPPYEKSLQDSYHGTSAALEFAVTGLEVRHIIVMGHSGCGGIKALSDAKESSDVAEDSSFIANWMHIAADAKQQVKRHDHHLSYEEQLCRCNHQSLKTSLHNLMTFSWVKERVAAEKLFLHAWYFDIESGQLLQYQEHNDCFLSCSSEHV